MKTSYVKAKLMSLLALLVSVTSCFVVAFTFAGDPELPDAVVTYTVKNRVPKLTWNTPIDDNGVAELNLFGTPENGEELPLIDPYSKGTYTLRFQNNVSGDVGYTVYIYTDNPHNIPLVFDVNEEAKQRPVDGVPADIADKQVLCSFAGRIEGYSRDNFNIDWKWDTESDEADTALGNLATEEDLVYKMNMLMVVEDNNSYAGGGSNPGNKPYVPTTGEAESDARILHRQYVKGYPEGDFRPEGNMTRAEVAAIFARILANYDETLLTDVDTDFTDVPKDKWYSNYVAKVEEMNVMNGYDNGTFMPDSPVTRAEFATVCVRYVEASAQTVILGKGKDFTDVTNAHWAMDYINKASVEALINGYPDDTFKPDDYIKRCEVVAIVNRMLSRYPDAVYINNNLVSLTQFTDLQDKSYWAYYEIYEAANTHHAKMKGPKEESWIPAK